MENKNVDKLFNRGTDTIYPTKEFLEQKIKDGAILKVYLGVDPTGQLHIGHTVPLRKLRHFQDLGHKVYILIGSFTAQIGDPTDKSQTRKQLTKEQVIENAKNYVTYAKCILDFDSGNPPEIVYNGDWLEKLTFKEVIELSSHFTVQQMLERDMFQKRLNNNLPIGLHEFMYPLMQGYDSVMLDVDVEVGGTDQTFNMLAGRKLLEQYRGKEKVVVSVPLLTDNNGKKMGKSDGNAVYLDLPPNDMYGSIMALSDGFLEGMFLLATDVEIEEIEKMMAEISRGANPMNYKKRLAFTITRMLHGEDLANDAQHAFESVVQGDALPEDIPVVSIKEDTLMLRDLLVILKLVSSNGEAKRLIEERAVSIFVDGIEKKLEDPKTIIEILTGIVVKVGKRRYAKIAKI